MLGRMERASPQFISISEGSWLGTSAVMERMTQISSMLSATRGNKSLTSMPLRPYFLNLKGEGKAAPVLRSVGRFSIGNSFQASFPRDGLGSKVSRGDGPPLAKI